MRTAWECRRSRLTPEEAISEIRGSMTRLPDPRDEIERAVEKVFATRVDRRTWAPPAPTWPDPDPERIAAIEETGFGVADLVEASPVRLDDPEPEDIISQLFPASALLCMAPTKTRSATRPMGEWIGSMRHLPLMVPSPMRCTWGMNQRGEPSQRCLDNTGPRRYLVTEFDGGTLDSQAARLNHLAACAPLVMALWSGSKSMHGWFRAEDIHEHVLRRFFSYACSLGADTATWTRCQLVRTPEADRDNGSRQTIFYLNPCLIP